MENEESKSNATETNAKKENLFLGNLKTRTRKNGEEIFVGSLCLESILDISEAHVQEGTNGKHYVRVIIQKNLGGADKYGNTHSIKVDTFSPGQNK